jgi:hypothetical protein
MTIENSMNHPTFCYICSAARSGSTLTDMILGGHPNAASLGELNFIGKAIELRELCSCGSTVRDCSEWKKIFIAILDNRRVDILKDPYKYRLWDARALRNRDCSYQTPFFMASVKLRGAYYDARSFLPPILRNYFPLPKSFKDSIKNKLNLYETISNCWGKKVIIDSSKNIREAIELYRARPDRMKLIFLTRDGRGIYLSERTSGSSRAKSIATWKKYYRRALWLMEKQLPSDTFFRLKYEDLARNPKTTTIALSKFLNVEYHPQMLNLGKNENHLVNGNDVRLQKDREIELDERWRKDLLGEELHYFNSKDNGLNMKLGYYGKES